MKNSKSTINIIDKKDLINKKKYVFKKYHPSYQKLFSKEKSKLLKVFPKNIQIEHVGSTSVPGLGGKGIIDIMIRAPKKYTKKYMRILENEGYQYSPHSVDAKRKFFQKIIKRNGKERRIHIHLTIAKDYLISFLAFRDYLRKNKEVRDEYARIKRQAVKYAKGSAIKYKDYKDDFIKETAKKALIERRIKNK